MLELRLPDRRALKDGGPSLWYEEDPLRVIRFYDALDAARARSGRSLASISRESGITVETINRWRRKKYMPTIKSARLIADALGDEGLLRLAIQARTRWCHECGDTFVVPNKPTNTCSNICAQRAARAKHRTIRADHSLRIARNSVRRFTLAVERFCHRCEPLGVCRQPKCELRLVSPLPIETRRP